MNMTQIPFGTTDWAGISPVEYKGEKGAAYWRTRQFGDIRVRMVEYTAGRGQCRRAPLLHAGGRKAFRSRLKRFAYENQEA